MERSREKACEGVVLSKPSYEKGNEIKIIKGETQTPEISDAQWN